MVEGSWGLAFSGVVAKYDHFLSCFCKVGGTINDSCRLLLILWQTNEFVGVERRESIAVTIGIATAKDSLSVIVVVDPYVRFCRVLFLLFS